MHNSRGQGSIFYNKARDNWTVLYYETDAKTGIRKRKSKSQPTKEMAERFFTSIIYQQKNPLYIKKHKILYTGNIRTFSNRNYFFNL